MSSLLFRDTRLELCALESFSTCIYEHFITAPNCVRLFIKKTFGMLHGFLKKIFAEGSNDTRLHASDVLCIAFSALRST